MLILIDNFLVYMFDQFLSTPISFKDSSMLKISSMFSAKSITAKSPDNGNVSQLKGNTKFNDIPTSYPPPIDPASFPCSKSPEAAVFFAGFLAKRASYSGSCFTISTFFTQLVLMSCHSATGADHSSITFLAIAPISTPPLIFRPVFGRSFQVL